MENALELACGLHLEAARALLEAGTLSVVQRESMRFKRHSHHPSHHNFMVAALTGAISSRSLAIVHLLIEYGVGPLSAEDPLAIDMVCQAIGNGATLVTDYLLHIVGVPVNTQGIRWYGVFPLYCSAIVRNLQAATALLNAGADVTLATSSGATALHGAVFRGHADVVTLLLKHGARATACMVSHA